MTNTQTSHSAKDALTKTLIFSAEHFRLGVLILGDERSSKLHPRDPEAVSQEAICEVNEALRDVPIRDLVEAAISICPAGAPDGRSIADKIPLKLTEVSPNADFRLQWNPVRPNYVPDPACPRQMHELHIRIIQKDQC